MKILITGGAGFIGSNIADDLLSAGYDVVIYDNFSTGRMDNLSGISKDCEIIRGDILDAEALEKAAASCDFISHHAAQLEIHKSSNNPLFDLQVNTVGTLNVLAAAARAGVQKIINASSACIYGQVNGITHENHYPRPNWAYGVSKLAAEKYCDIANDYQGLPVVNLRYAITYGEREWYRRVLTIFVKRIVSGLPPVVFGKGDQIRDFVYVGDAVRLHRMCLENDKSNGQSYNVGTGVATTIRRLAEMCVQASGLDFESIFEDIQEGAFSSEIPGKRRNAEELKIMLLGVDKANVELGWKPQVGLLEGLGRSIAWLRENPGRWDKILSTE